MSGFLLDTNVISELVQKKPDERVMAWSDAAGEELLHLSVLTLGEIRQGIAMLPQSRRRISLETWLDVELRDRFAGRILSVDSAVADRWGKLTARANLAGRPLPIIDSLLAATALLHGLTIVTRNIRDFERMDVDVVNPWEA